MARMADENVQLVAEVDKSSAQLAVADLLEGLRDNERWRRFSFFYFKRTYWRTSLGVLWPVVTFFLFVLMLSLLWGNLFGRELSVYLPHFGYGFTCWIFLNGMMSGGDQVFNANSAIIREFPLPLSFYAYSKMAREMTLFAMSLGCMILFDVFYIHKISLVSLLVIPAIFVYAVDGVLVALIMGMLTTRYRDISQIVPTVMRAFFFFTPVLWTVEARERLWPIIVSNPMYHAIEIVRAPMSGKLPLPINWIVMLGVTAVLLLIFLSTFKNGTRNLRVWL